MMTTTIETFDTLLYAKKLKNAGCDETQAEIQAEALKTFSDQQTSALRESLEHQVISRQDILLLKNEIDKVRIEMKSADDSMKWKLNTILSLLTLFGTLITLAQFIK